MPIPVFYMSQMNALVQSFSSMRHEMSQISGQWAYQPKTEPQEVAHANIPQISSSEFISENDRK